MAMGRATRWLKALLSGGGDKKSKKTSFDASATREKKGWSFARSFRDKGREGGGGRVFHGSGVPEVSSPPPPPVVVVGVGNGNDQRAIAVAEATAAAAEAAVAAATVVVRLTSSRGSVASGTTIKVWAAIKIQAIFRGYLARRALKALKGLVKLQALVRGHIVRKQVVEALRCMQALVRAQSRVCAGRTPNNGPRQHHSHRHVCSKTPENMEKMDSIVDPKSSQPSDWNWLDQWMEERYWDGREAVSGGGTGTRMFADDGKKEKILEVDAGKPHHLSCRSAHDDSPSKDPTTTAAHQFLPIPCSSAMQRPFEAPSNSLCESPQLYPASSRGRSWRRRSLTPTKSECSQRRFSGLPDHPNYMSNTESFKAKVRRSYSAPRQRPDQLEKSGSVRRF